jgi:hypothetical protein
LQGWQKLLRGKDFLVAGGGFERTDLWAMSQAMVGILITYKTRVALKVIVANGKEPLLDR